MTAAPAVVRRSGAVVVLLLAVYLAVAPARAGSLAEGKVLYRQHCEQCHGQDGRPVIPGGPDFTRGDGLFRSDVALLNAILSTEIIMHGFEGRLREQETFDIITYIRALY